MLANSQHAQLAFAFPSISCSIQREHTLFFPHASPSQRPKHPHSQGRKPRTSSTCRAPASWRPGRRSAGRRGRPMAALHVCGCPPPSNCSAAGLRLAAAPWPTSSTAIVSASGASRSRCRHDRTRRFPCALRWRRSMPRRRASPAPTDGPTGVRRPPGVGVLGTSPAPPPSPTAKGRNGHSNLFGGALRRRHPCRCYS